MNMNNDGLRSNLKNGNELVFVGLIFFFASLFGLISLFYNKDLIRGIYKTVDPGAGMLPLIIVAFITAGSLFYLIYGFYHVYKNKESINFTFIKFDKFVFKIVGVPSVASGNNSPPACALPTKFLFLSYANISISNVLGEFL